MAIVVRAVYENGVFRPLEELGLPVADSQEVRITIEPETNRQQNHARSSDWADPLAGVRVDTGIPDLAEHFDDYRFGRRQP